MTTLARETLDIQAANLYDDLKKHHGDKIVMMALYGSAAREDFDPEKSDVNLLIVLEDADPELLARLAPPLQAAKVSWRCSPLVLGREELINALDVFAIKFHEISRNYRIIGGRDMLRHIQTQVKELRLVCEYELRNIDLKLRRAFILGAPDPKLLYHALHRFLPQLVSILRVVLEQELGHNLTGSLPEEAAHRFGFESQELQKVMEIRRKPEANWPEVDRAYRQVHQILHKVISIVDRWDTPR